jgi:hypothetical protein
MAINFPSTPTIGQTFVVGTKVYTWDGTRWTFDFRNLAKGTTAERPTVDKPFVYYNTTLRVYEVWRPEYSVWEAVWTYPIQETLIDPTVTYSEATYTTPGTYQWECPAGVAYVHVVCVGGGGGGKSSTVSNYYNTGGAGGGLGWKNNIPVTPGNLYTVQVGAGGTSKLGQTTDNTINGGGNSYFIDTSTVAGLGAAGGSFPAFGLPGGGWVGDGGGNGGAIGPTVDTVWVNGGGGAGGYTGNGGDGYYYNGATSIAATAGSGGGGGGGGSWYFQEYGRAGGGVGILGRGTSGAAGIHTGNTGTDASTAGGGGSGSTTRIAGDFRGGQYGGGAGASGAAAITQQDGGGGAVRIIWGAGRAFPSTNTGVM